MFILEIDLTLPHFFYPYHKYLIIRRRKFSCGNSLCATETNTSVFFGIKNIHFFFHVMLQKSSLSSKLVGFFCVYYIVSGAMVLSTFIFYLILIFLAKVILNLIKYIGWKESCFNSIPF